MLTKNNRIMAKCRNIVSPAVLSHLYIYIICMSVIGSQNSDIYIRYEIISDIKFSVRGNQKCDLEDYENQ